MSSKPRKRLFGYRNTLKYGNSHNSISAELDTMMETDYNDLIVKYSLDNLTSKVKRRKIDWHDEYESNLPDFYYCHPKRKYQKAEKLM